MRSNAYAEDTVDFNANVRPILSDKCFKCHGFDDRSRAADLRLDQRDSAVDYGAIVPGNVDESLILERIVSTDPDLVMPPPGSNKSLSQSEVDTLTQWVAQGARYDQHWAFTRIERPDVPTGYGGTHPIDRFVRERLDDSPLSPSPEANRYTLIRRITQDLTGLLPTPEEVDAFVADESPNAYENLVDRLLASPHYGERWGRHWLDQARYADSHGYTIDGARVMWPFRDWVINAHNRDLPFDQFTIEQLAGDLLPQPTKAQLVATAFHRNTMINQEGGVKADQYRNEALVDRVNTTSAVWLGMTVACAQCHTHKYDPISHTEYYQLYAFFNGAADANNAGPQVDVHEGEMFGFSDKQYEAIAKLAELKARRAELEKKKSANADSWIASAAWDWSMPTSLQATTEDGSPFELLGDGSVLAPKELSPNPTYELKTESQTPVAAIRLQVLTHESLPKQGPGRAGNGNFVLSSVRLKAEGVDVPIVDVWADHSQPDYPITATLDSDSQTGWAINVGNEDKKRGVRMNANHEAIFVLERPASGAITIELRHDRNPNYQVGRLAIAFAGETERVPNDGQDLAEQIAEVQQEIEGLQSLLPAGDKAVRQMIIREVDKPKPTYRLERGDFLSPDKEVGPLRPNVPTALAAEHHTFENRLDLSRWLVSRDNPLTARVIVNRVWMRYFGKGLVETENDFGFQGTPPTHPKLLDWLAAEFMEPSIDGVAPWSMKHLHRTIVSSATYRQSSNVTRQSLQADPSNRLLARQSRFRVEAEIVRDQALVASGLFSPKVGGPPVHPPQPEGIYAFTQSKKSWPTASGPDRYRRTMYTMFYRSAPHPLLTTFDAPDFSVVCTRRVRSNTPLQALSTANDPMFIELAKGVAARAAEGGSGGEIGLMVRLLLTRPVREDEAVVLRSFYERELARGDADSARTAVARVLLNTDEFLTRN